MIARGGDRGRCDLVAEQRRGGARTRRRSRRWRSPSRRRRSRPGAAGRRRRRCRSPRRRWSCGSRPMPGGAKVVDGVDGALLGTTPLVLTRPRGGTLTLRFEKDGYGAEHADDGARRRSRDRADARTEAANTSRRSASARRASRRQRAGEALRAPEGDGPARRARFAHPGVRLSGHHLRGGRAGLLRLSLRGRVVGAQQGVADGGEPADARSSLSGRVQDRIDRAGRRAVRGGRVGRPGDGSAVVVRAARGRRVGRRARRGPEDPLGLPGARSGAPAARARSLGRATSRASSWKSLQPWTPSHAGNFRHLHQLFEGKSVLIAYVAKKTERRPHLLRRRQARPRAESRRTGSPTRWTTCRSGTGGSRSSTRWRARSTASRSPPPSSSTSRRSARRSTPGASRSRRATSTSCASRPTRSACWACCSCRCRW